MDGEPSTRPLTTADAASLREFRCAGYREPWSALIEEMIQEQLADEIAHGSCRAAGIWLGGQLVGLYAWRLDPTTGVARSILLAVRITGRRQGIGHQLKGHLLAEARAAGARELVSLVDWDNEPMLRLNQRLGASIRRLPGDDQYALCVLPL